MNELDKKLQQCRRPSGPEGKVVGEEMNIRHQQLWMWGLEHIELSPGSAILDIGFGGGMSLQVLSSLNPEGEVYGIDYSDEMVKLARDVNEESINSGKIQILQGSVSGIPFKDLTFDIACAFETCYFWPDLIENFREIHRTLKDEGMLLVVNEVYDHPHFKDRNSRYALNTGMKYYKPEEYRKYLYQAGYSSAEIHEIPEKNWIAMIAEK